MGRKSKSPVELKSNCGGTLVPPQDSLPPFKRYIDIEGKNGETKSLIRLFLAAATNEDVADTVRLNESKQFLLTVVAAKMPYMNTRSSAVPLFEYVRAHGFPDDFATDLARLVTKHLKGKHLSVGAVRTFTNALRHFVKFLAARSPKPLSLTDIDKRVWLDFLAALESGQRKDAKEIFNYARASFKEYEVTSLGGWLASFRFRGSRTTEPSPEHSSELAEASDYSDVVMYQLLSLFIYEFNRRLGYLKRYESITETDMPKNWLNPEFKAMRDKGDGYDSRQLLREWLLDEGAGYEILIDHYLMHHKVGLIKRRDRSGGLEGGISYSLKNLRERGERALASKFQEEMGRRHGYEHAKGKRSLLSFYLKKTKPTEPNGVINQIGWCLANLVMMQTGVNKEVVLTIPSKAEDGNSILTRGDTVFVKKEGAETEIHLYGIKAKVGNAPKKIIPVIIVKHSPLYEMLVDYERYVKVGNGPFFEFNNSFISSWAIAGGVNDLSKNYPVTDENGNQLSSIQTTRFRRVFASGQLLDRMKNIREMNELAEMLRNDLNHGNLDTTLTHYLMKSTVGRSVIDIAIATITGDKLNDLKCKSQIEGGDRKSIQFKKKVFLCHCIDPLNPSHDVAIADECRHYDLCLGCEQSIITKEHLPYICLRIMQYEEEREKAPHIWPALYEDKWCIAHNALSRYIESDKKNGRFLVDEACIAARNGRVTLPPIIAPNRI